MSSMNDKEKTSSKKAWILAVKVMKDNKRRGLKKHKEDQRCEKRRMVVVTEVVEGKGLKNHKKE